MIRKFPLAITLALLAIGARAQTNTGFVRTEDIIYGRKEGMALTLDVFQPADPNGAGILWIVSSGFGSSHDAIHPRYFSALLSRGYTVIAVVHGSAPRFSVPEIETDIHRAARFVRHNADRFGVDGKRLGACGASAGAHLALMLATKGQPGELASQDPVDWESSAIQCAACFFPPTDFLNYGRPGLEAEWIQPLLGLDATNGDQAAFAAKATELRKEISPIYYVHSNQPPVLILQGDKDYMVPMEQAQTFASRSRELGGRVKLVLKPGQGHGWPNMIEDMELVADWFDAEMLKK